jgi:hypothetical protein
MQASLVVALVLASAIVFVPTSARAASCPSGKHIFVRTGSTTNRWGVRGKIEVPFRDIDGCNTAAAYTTVHLTNCALQCGTQVEIGIQQTSSQLFIFTEKELSGMVLKYDQITTASHNLPTDLRLKVAQSGDVFFEYNFGGGWSTTWSSPYNISWAPGYPMGESEKRGDDTQMTSERRNMRYVKSDWSEATWSSMTCVKDEAPGWSWSPVNSTNDYDVVGVGAGECDAV